ncbi:ABC transporter ATP-binding protein [Bradyrhizobium sp. NP1]|uniref:ABC transporter ATP-binding protein n=1 Tax=Bradyrhizobium sp. NP1 TaxID=3049772 RepID=UPI0025A5E559|nr:ABC transporter ATP-binding protein [Bradyrhizobium sp. NP1]WJR77277.1 ABC transporter ATP-binding protein [Bradyrhizobium sp. NP1]
MMDRLTVHEAPAVEVVDVRKEFANFIALHGVSVDIRRNEFFSLLGPSGCGKTTLLRIIGGFEAPTGGEVRIHGESVVDLPPYRRKTNMVFQHLALFPHLSVVENILFPLEMKRTPAALARKKAMDVLEMVRLSGMQDRKIHELSGGQRQRVAIARALVGDPEVVLLDEPLGALDLKLRLQMQEELRRLQKAVGSTFIFVTHDQAEAIAMSDRIAVMQAGRIIQVGTPHDIYETPSCRFVADFIGHSNLLKGVVAQEPGGEHCVVSVGDIRLTGLCRATVTRGQDVTVAIRYEKIRVARSLPKNCSNAFDADVVDVKYLGSALRLKLALSQGQQLQADLPPDFESSAIRQGARVTVSIEPSNVVVLAD